MRIFTLFDFNSIKAEYWRGDSNFDGQMLAVEWEVWDFTFKEGLIE